MAGAPAPVKEPANGPWGGFGSTGPFGVTPGQTYEGHPLSVAGPSTKAPWQAPPPPPTSYNPIRDINIGTGRLSTEQTVKGLERQRENGSLNFTANKEEIERKGQDTLAKLAESYKRLGARQGEQANADGTLYGGAVLAAAAKRATNEGLQKQSQQEAQEAELGRLGNNFSQQQGTLTEGITNANESGRNAREGEETLRNNESVNNGYSPETSAQALAAHTLATQRAQNIVQKRSEPIKWSRDPKMRAIQAKRGY